MATYYGTFFPRTILSQVVNLNDLAPIPLVVSAVKTNSPVAGNLHISTFSPERRTYSGVREDSLWGVLKNKIIISTTEINLGSIVDKLQKNVEIWNTFLEQATLETISKSAEQGITISGISIGDILDGLHGVAVTFTVARFGALSVNTLFYFGYDLQAVSVLLKGTRGIVLVDRPLIDGYVESRAFETDIFISENGTEHRTALMDAEIPRREIIFPFKIGRGKNDRYASIGNIVTFGLKYAVFVPLWHSATSLTASPSGTTTIYCDTSNCDFDQVDKLVIISRSDLSYAVRNISSIGSTSLVLDQTVSGFSVGDFVIPVIGATPDTDNSLQWDAATGYGKLKFTEIDE